MNNVCCLFLFFFKVQLYYSFDCCRSILTTGRKNLNICPSKKLSPSFIVLKLIMFNKYMLLKGAVSQHFSAFLFHKMNPPSLCLKWSKNLVNSFIFDKIFVKQRFAPTNAVLSPYKSGENYMRSEKSVKIWSTARVDSLVFFSFAENETVRNMSLFRRVSQNWKK